MVPLKAFDALIAELMAIDTVVKKQRSAAKGTRSL
jgi:hypothetical protein